jgi:hypothetical protein
MKINFRQGIVTYEQSTGGQAFLQVPSAGTANIIGEVTVAFAHRTANYLHVQVDSVSPAWVSLPTTGDVWIYWDIDVKTAALTYGYTQVQPTSGNTQPTAVNDLHWFDTVTNTMKVYETNRWQERIRVFAARINGTQIFPMGSTAATPYAGSQVGINSVAYAGQILFASSLPVIVNTSNSFSPPAFGRAYVFATTETEFVTSSAQKVNTIRLESDFTTAAAAENLAAYDVVKYNAAGRLEAAGYNDTSTTVIGIITDDVSINSLATVVLQGVVTNEQWNWPTIGAELFISNDGELTADDPNLQTPSLYPVSKPPVARVLNSKEIIFMQGLGKVGPRGLNPTDINTIGNVSITAPTNNQVLTYTGSPQLWRNSDAVNSLAGLTDTEIGSPVAAVADDFLQYDGTNWVNQTRRQANVGYFGVTPNTHDTNYTFVQGDAGQGHHTTTALGSPNATTYTWTLNPGIFKLGDVLTIGRRFNAANINLATGANVVIQSQIDGTATDTGSPLPQFTLDNPSQATLWLIEAVGSPYGAGSPGGTDTWLINGVGVATV